MENAIMDPEHGVFLMLALFSTLAIGAHVWLFCRRRQRKE